MRNEIMFAGFGGQGIVKAALLLTQAAGLFEDREVAQTQSYGPEARGGACRSEVVISDEKIAYIKTTRLDALVVMSAPALATYMPLLDPKHTRVVADATLITQAPPTLQRFYPIEATRIAEEELGRTLFANILMLGALVAVTGIVTLDALREALVGNVPASTLEMNRAALQKGHALATALVEINP
jgi:2-oxoglutarate ferredoxin oxidoreductase subunit gamma